MINDSYHILCIFCVTPSLFLKLFYSRNTFHLWASVSCLRKEVFQFVGSFLSTRLVYNLIIVTVNITTTTTRQLGEQTEKTALFQVLILNLWFILNGRLNCKKHIFNGGNFVWWKNFSVVTQSCFKFSIRTHFQTNVFFFPISVTIWRSTLGVVLAFVEI